MKYYVEFVNIAFVSDIKFKSNGLGFVDYEMLKGDYKSHIPDLFFRCYLSQVDKLLNIQFHYSTRIEMKDLTSHHPCIVKVEYADPIVINSKSRIPFRYVDYESKIVSVPQYQEAIHDHHPTGVMILTHYHPLEITLTSNDIILLQEADFRARQINTDFAETRMVKHDVDREKTFYKGLNRLIHSTDSWLITGKAGTGKTTLLQQYRKKSSESLAVLSPTGLSAQQIGGQTIHSFFTLPPRVLNLNTMEIPYHRKLKHLDTLLIDEISLVRADLLDAIDQVLRKSRDSEKVFGGVKLCLFGDIGQIPPVLESSKPIRAFFKDAYKSKWFFDSNAYHTSFKIENLTEIYRQTDSEFIDILGRIREGVQTDDDIMAINSTCYRKIPSHLKVLTLTTTNNHAKKVNLEKLDKITGVPTIYIGEFFGEYPRTSNNLPADYELTLKIGAQVIFVKNDIHKRWMNGTIGIISGLFDSSIGVTVGQEELQVEKDIWSHIKYQYDKHEKRLTPKVMGEFKQYPLRLAWALTIHKSQGQTFKNVVVDTSGRIFAPGQLYVALSRCVSMKGLYLKAPLGHADVITDSRAIQFLQRNGL